MSFPCTECGACCRATFALTVFGLPVDQNGHCSYLKDDLCSIYEVRPEPCRIEFWKRRSYSPETFNRRTANACNELQRQQGIGPEFRVVLE